MPYGYHDVRWQALVDEALKRAEARGHDMDQLAGDGIQTAMYKCRACGLDFVIGHPKEGGELQVTTDAACQVDCTWARLGHRSAD